MPSWPGTLPQKPSDQDLQISQEENRASFRPDVGEPMFRRRSTARSYIYQLSFELTQAQKATLDTFFETTCLDGSVSFTWADPFKLDTGTFVFETVVVYRSFGPVMYRASFTLRRLP